jgi:hypothetical protein
MSTTTNWNVAVQYSGVDKKRGNVFEIEVGRIDIGADILWLSQYPGEAEYLFPPLSCLEVNGEPRLKGDVIVFPLLMNLCLKGLTLEQLEERRKELHIAMTKNLTEELDVQSGKPMPLSPSDSDLKDEVEALKKELEAARAVVKKIERSGVDCKANQIAIQNFKQLEDKLNAARDKVKMEFKGAFKAHGESPIKVFNNNVTYKLLTAEAIDSKSNALNKIRFHRDNLLELHKPLFKVSWDTPYKSPSSLEKGNRLRVRLV